MDEEIYKLVSPEQKFTPEFLEFVDRLIESMDENLETFLEYDNSRPDTTDQMGLQIPFAQTRYNHPDQIKFVESKFQEYLESRGADLLHLAMAGEVLYLIFLKPQQFDEKIIKPETGERIKLELVQQCAWCGDTVSREFSGLKPEIKIVQGKKGKKDKKGKLIEPKVEFVVDIDLGWIDHICSKDGETRPVWLGIKKKSSDIGVLEEWLQSIKANQD